MVKYEQIVSGHVFLAQFRRQWVGYILGLKSLKEEETVQWVKKVWDNMAPLTKIAQIYE